MEIKNIDYKKKTRLKDIINAIDKAGLVAAKIIAVGTFATGIMLVSTFPGKSITVQKGSNLSQIAREYDITWQRLEKRNKLKDPNYILEGQDLIIYKKGPVGVFQRTYDKLKKYVF